MGNIHSMTNSLGNIRRVMRDQLDKRTDMPVSIALGMVTSIDDPRGARRVRIRVYPYDSRTPEENIPYAWPIVPPHVWVEPQVGELMVVFFQNPYYPYKGRFYSGPLLGAGEVDGQTFDGTLDSIWKDEKEERSLPNDRPQEGMVEGTPENG